VLLNAAGNIGEAALALVLAVMLSLEPHLVDRMSRYLPGEGWSEALATTWARMGYWARSQAAVALVFGLLFGLWLTIVGVPTGWALGVLGGVLEVIPFIGGISVALLATIVALGKSLSAAGLVLAGYGVIALMQGKLIIPLIYGRNLGYHPAMVLLAIFVGGKLFGPLGILLGVPGLILLHNLYIVWAKPGSNQFHL
jgi:predicted PurR-regulated permease PerM